MFIAIKKVKIIQIFRVHQNHDISARFLDNKRLSKQVLELYQIIRVCLAEMGIISANTRYLSHPIVKHIYNNGHPYLLDAFELLKSYDQEHKRRGGVRSINFKEKLIDLERIIYSNKHLFSERRLPAFYVYQDKKVYGKMAYTHYESLLFLKWSNDKVPPRCNINLDKGEILK